MSRIRLFCATGGWRRLGYSARSARRHPMENERWQRIEELYHSALGRNIEERAKFLADVCKDDISLRKEVESLLGADGKAADFIEAPAIQVAAQLLTPEEVQQHGPRILEP